MVYFIPFTSFSLTNKIAWGSVLAIAGEITFWLGTLILGKGIIKNVFKKITSWFKKITSWFNKPPKEM